jgi:hypothetical protein
MKGLSPSKVPRGLRLFQWSWILSIGVVLAWHASVRILDRHPETMIGVVLAYILVCLPASLAVYVVLAFVGWLSGGYRYDDLVGASLFVTAGWLQWFRVAPWLESRSARSFRSRPSPNQDPD